MINQIIDISPEEEEFRTNLERCKGFLAFSISVKEEDPTPVSLALIEMSSFLMAKFLDEEERTKFLHSIEELIDFYEGCLKENGRINKRQNVKKSIKKKNEN